MLEILDIAEKLLFMLFFLLLSLSIFIFYRAVIEFDLNCTLIVFLEKKLQKIALEKDNVLDTVKYIKLPYKQ